MTASSDIELEDDFRSETWRCRVALTDANADGAAAPHFLLVIGFLPLWGVEHEAVCGLTTETTVCVCNPSAVEPWSAEETTTSPWVLNLFCICVQIHEKILPHCALFMFSTSRHHCFPCANHPILDAWSRIIPCIGFPHPENSPGLWILLVYASGGRSLPSQCYFW